MKRILISVTNKSGLEAFKALTDTGLWEIISTGNTAKELERLGIPNRTVGEVTGFPEILGGRVKTLHPRIFAGILANRNSDSDMQQLAEHDIAPIDVVICNLYDFAGNPDIETIDIGGSSLIRAAAKNGLDTLAIVRPADYPQAILHLLSDNIPIGFREHLSSMAFEHTASYDLMIARWMRESTGQETSFLVPKITVH